MLNSSLASISILVLTVVITFTLSPANAYVIEIYGDSVCGQVWATASCSDVSQRCQNGEISPDTTCLRIKGCHDQFPSLPPHMFRHCHLPKLICLDLSSNNITSIHSDTFFDLEASGGAAIVDLSSNLLTSLGNGFLSPLTRAIQLYIVDNQLTHLGPAAFRNLSKLATAQLFSNHITQIEPGTFEHQRAMETLVPSMNRITSVRNHAFGSHPRLRQLFLNNNQLSIIESQAFYNMTNLHELNLGTNRLSYLHGDTFVMQNKLEHLSFRGNQLSSVSPFLLAFTNALQTLDLSHNMFKQLPRLFYWTRLASLDISYNSITAYDAGWQFSGSPKLLFNGNPIGIVTNATPNTVGEPRTVSFVGTRLTSPSDFNNMGLSGPSFVLPQGVHITCQQTPLFHVDEDGADIDSSEANYVETKCRCDTNFKEIHGRCVDQTPTYVGVGTTMGIMFGACIGAAAVMAIRRVRRARFRVAQLSDDLTMRELLIAEKDANIETLVAAWRIEASELDLDRKIDAGAFGEVWRGRWGTLPVAVKILHQSLASIDSSHVDEFEAEVDFLMRCRHSNIVRFLGAGEREGLPFLVMEFMARGSLKAYVHDGTNTLDWPTRFRFAREIAAGLAHIHALGQMHRDVKTANVLLDAGLHCKIADFGLVKQIMTEGRANGSRSTATVTADDSDDRASDSGNMTAGKGTPVYMAPEVMRGQRYYFSADVFSYGVVLWEIAARRRPDLEKELGLEFPGGPFMLWLEKRLSEGCRLPCDSSWPQQYVDMIQSCWSTVPADRPRFRDIVVDNGGGGGVERDGVDGGLG